MKICDSKQNISVSDSQTAFSKDSSWPLTQNNREALRIAQSVNCLLQPKSNPQNTCGENMVQTLNSSPREKRIGR